MKHDPPASAATVLFWDLPARICHWGFALSCTASLVIAWRCHPESDAFKAHLLLGILAAWFLAVRILLGFCGAPASRWRTWPLAPASILRYFADVVAGRATEGVGLNPGSALFAAAIYLALIGLIYTGFAADWVEKWHGRLAYGVIGLIACHLLGLALHALRHRAPTPLAMIHGRRRGKAAAVPAGERRLAGLLLLVLSGIIAWLIFHGFDANTSVLRLPFLPEIAFPLIQKG